MKQCHGMTEVVKSIDSRDSQLYTAEEQWKSSSEIANEIANRPQSIDMPSLISMEILEAHGRSSNVDQSEVLQRATEMSRILKDTEKYLAEVAAETKPNRKEYYQSHML